VTADQLAVAASYPRHTVLRDSSGTVWVKKGCVWQRPGSLGEYGPEALVWPASVLFRPD
jgi:hypothetical protein